MRFTYRGSHRSGHRGRSRKVGEALAKIALMLVLCAGTIALWRSPSFSDDKPPAGIIPSSATLPQVLAGYDKAHAGKFPSTSIEEGRILWYGIKGTYRGIRSGNNYRFDYDLGPLSFSSGQLYRQKWRQNQNGVVTLVQDANQEDAIAQAALSGHAGSDNSGLTLAGESQNPAAYVIEIDAPGGRHEWRYYDKQTYELLKSDEVYPSRRVITTYADYRTASGFTHAWHVHQSDGYPLNDLDYVTTSMQYNVPVAGSALDIPQSNPNLVQFPTGAQSVRLPVRFIDGDVFVTVTINNRNLDFVLDSGSSSIFIDSQVANQLGLSKFGQYVSLAGGDFEASQVIAPAMNIGDIQMKNVAMESGAFNRPLNARMSIVGLLGFDFFAGGVVEVDYKDQTLDVIPQSQFVPPPNAFAVYANWDQSTPAVNVLVGDVPANFLVDSGAQKNAIFSSFAQAHADAVRDQGGGIIMRQNSISGFYYGQGIGGDFQATPTQVKTFTLSNFTFKQYMMYVIPDSAYNNEAFNGIIGQEFLSMFTVYFDYKDRLIYLIPTSKDFHPVQ